MERVHIICKSKKMSDVSYLLIEFLEIHKFEIYKPKPQLENYKCKSPNCAFNIIIDIENLEDNAIQVVFEYCEGNRDYFSKTIKYAEKLLTTEPPLNAIDTAFIYYSC